MSGEMILQVIQNGWGLGTIAGVGGQPSAKHSANCGNGKYIAS